MKQTTYKEDRDLWTSLKKCILRMGKRAEASKPSQAGVFPISVKHSAYLWPGQCRPIYPQISSQSMEQSPLMCVFFLACIESLSTEPVPIQAHLLRGYKDLLAPSLPNVHASQNQSNVREGVGDRSGSESERGKKGGSAERELLT